MGKNLYENIRNFFDANELLALKAQDVKSMKIFYSKHPLVRLAHRIEETNYSLLLLKNDKTQLDEMSFQNASVSHWENETFNYGSIRATTQPYKSFDQNEHKDQYMKLAKFIITHCQDQLKSTYNLKEVRVPENKVID